MPLVKVIRNGQITIPKELRSVLGIQEGDFLEINLKGRNMVIEPKVAIDKDLAQEELFQIVKKMRDNVNEVDPKELDQTIREAVKAAKKPLPVI